MDTDNEILVDYFINMNNFSILNLPLIRERSGQSARPNVAAHSAPEPLAGRAWKTFLNRPV
jgi:hypothetical protein